MQAILVIAYFPVVKRLVESKENTEPFSVWIGMLLAPSLALFQARVHWHCLFGQSNYMCKYFIAAHAENRNFEDEEEFKTIKIMDPSEQLEIETRIGEVSKVYLIRSIL